MSPQNSNPGEKGEQPETVIDTNEEEETMTITYWDKNTNNGGRGLEAKVYQFVDGDYLQLPLVKSRTEADNGPRFAEGKTYLTAYNAVAKLADQPHVFGQPKVPKSATFVAAIRLFEDGEKEGDVWPSLPTSKQFYDHIGINPLDLHATGAMWEGIFLDRRTYSTGSEPVLDLAEINMIGRSLEKILQVDIIPATFSDDDEASREKYSVLVSNLFIKGNVDLRALL
jgi:hypothetical protein